MQIRLVLFFFTRNILVRVIQSNCGTNLSIVGNIEVVNDFSFSYFKYIGKITGLNYRIFYLKNWISDKLVWMSHIKMKGELLLWSHFRDWLLPYHGEGYLKLKLKKKLSSLHTKYFPFEFTLEFCPAVHKILDIASLILGMWII